MTNVINFADRVNAMATAKEAARVARRDRVIAVYELNCDIERVEHQIQTFMDLSKEFTRADDKFIALSMANDERRKLAELRQQLAAM